MPPFLIPLSNIFCNIPVGSFLVSIGTLLNTQDHQNQSPQILPGIVVHACNTALKRQKQEDGDFRDQPKLHGETQIYTYT